MTGMRRQIVKFSTFLLNKISLHKRKKVIQILNESEEMIWAFPFPLLFSRSLQHSRSE
jgi:hypothetical protein